MSDFKEIEFKYFAHDISRARFNSAVKSIGGIKKELCLFASSTNGKDSVDHYFTFFDATVDAGNQRFMRWREGQTDKGVKTWELTSKIKLNENNNNVRSEVNISLNAKDMSIEKAVEFSSHHGCVYDFSIKKDVQIYWMEDPIVLSHYTTYDLNGKELNTFMEIEADESFSWKGETEALEMISAWEKKLQGLGITAQNRIKRSLFEFYSGKFKQIGRTGGFIELF